MDEDQITDPATLMHSPGLEVRQFQIRAIDTDKREITGIAVPWDQEIRIDSWFGDAYYESMARGACETKDGEPKAFWLHRNVIGRAVSTRDTDEGWEVVLRISDTPTGNEAYTLARDGAVDRMSIGFTPIEQTETKDDDGRRHITRTRVQVREVSLVPFPAYEGAKVSSVRHTNPAPREEAPPMEDENQEVNELRTAVEDLTRQISLIGTADDGPTTDTFRSIGEYVRAAVTGDERATEALANAVRAFDPETDQVSADGILQDQWIGDIVELASQAQPVLQAFGGTGTLPAEGLNVEWGVLEDDSTDFDRQLAEGDNLVVGKIRLGTRTAPVITAGGASNLSVQAIERTTNVNLLSTLWEALLLKGARYIERLHRTTTLGAVAAAPETVPVDLSSARGMVEAALDVVEFFDGEDLILDGVFASKSQVLDLYDVPEFKSAMALVGAANDKVGALSVARPGQIIGHIAGVLPVRLYPNAPVGFQMFAYDRRSVRTLEAPGAPFRITNDVSALNLTKPIGAYTYASSFAQRPNGIVPLGTD